MASKLSKQQAIHSLWRAGCLRYKLHAGQEALYDAIHASWRAGEKEFALRIGRQFGKSYLTIVLALEMCIRHPGIIVRIAGPTLSSCTDIVEDNLAPICADAPPGLIERAKSSRRYTIKHPSGKHSSLRIGTLERAHVDKTMRGGNAYAIFCEEAAISVKSEDLDYAMRSVIGPQLLRSSKLPGGGILGFVTTPASVPTHYFHAEIEPRCMVAGTYHTATVYDNPQLSQEQIEIAIKRCGGEHTEAWRREYLCEMFRSELSTIVPEFDLQQHVYEFEPPEHRKLYTCMDFGISRDHHHAVLYYWDFLAARLCILNEAHAEAHVNTTDFLAQVRDMESMDAFGPTKRFGDLSGRTENDLKTTYNFDITQTAKDDKDAALANLRAMFGQGLIAIHPRCRHTIACLQGAQWNKARTDWERTPVYGHADAIAALVYTARNVDKSNPIPPRPEDEMLAKLKRHKPTTGFNKLAQLWGSK